MKNVMKFSVVAAILSLGMIVSSAVLSKLFIRIRQEQAITVKGYAEKDIVSDIGKFSCSYSTKGAGLKESYVELQKNKNYVLGYLKQIGFSEPEIAIGTIGISEIHKRNDKGNDTNEIEYYKIYQRITITSKNVTLLKNVSSSITDLIKEGIEISATDPEFYISDLKNTKLELLAKATDDGYRRAISLAENSRGKVGSLISAQQGVIQITERNSVDTSGYGVYDTRSIEKTVKVVVTLEYAIQPDK